MALSDNAEAVASVCRLVHHQICKGDRAVAVGGRSPSVSFTTLLCPTQILTNKKLRNAPQCAPRSHIHLDGHLPWPTNLHWHHRIPHLHPHRACSLPSPAALSSTSNVILFGY